MGGVDFSKSSVAGINPRTPALGEQQVLGDMLGVWELCP